MSEVKHIGLSPHRLKENPLEKVFANAWVEQNDKRAGRRNGVLELLLLSNGDGKVFGELTQAQATEAATVIQWLGSSVGFGFLQETLAKAGFEIKERDGAAR